MQKKNKMGNAKISLKKCFFASSVLLIMLLFAVVSYADSHLPANILKIKEYNKTVSQNIALKVSFFVAFIAGTLGILSPCILPFLPAYFSYTFKEKKNITLMTLIFFFGFSAAFVIMGVIAGYLGAQAFGIVQSDWLMVVVGIFIISMGLLSIFGKGFSSFFSRGKRFENDIPGTFLFGVFFAVGWSACLGPILAGVLGIGALLHSPLQSALLLFFYSLGNLAPLFILAVFYDRLNLSKSRIVKGKMLAFSAAGKKFELHSTNLISGIIFLMLGLVIIIFRGTDVVNTWDFFRTKDYFFMAQNGLLSWKYTNIVSIAAFALFLLLIIYALFKMKNKSKTNHSD